MGRTLYLDDFLQEGEPFAYSLHRAMAEARACGAAALILSGGDYTLDATFCDERMLCYSNHGHNGPKRIGVLIEDMQDFTLDLGGACLTVGDGILTPIAVLGSSRITVKNGRLRCPHADMLELRVTAHGDGYIDTEPLTPLADLQLLDGRLYAVHDWLLAPVYTNIEFCPDGGLAPGTGDHTLGADPGRALTYEPLPGGGLRIHGGKRQPPIGNILVFNAAQRLAAGIFCEGSSELLFEDVTVNSCFGMGLLAQLCRDVTLRRFATRRHGQYHTANADATHFVSCTGCVTVEDCFFEGQLDDALNIHGLYTRILRAEGRELLLREMHEQARGIRIFRAGQRLAALRPDTLLPYATAEIAAVEYINGELVRVLLTEDVGEIAAGDDIEILSESVSLVFRRNTVRDNRARGMLIAARGQVLIEDCDFHVGGASILFESDGRYWFESGATRDVTVRGCRFFEGKHATWGSAIIAAVPREASEAGRYYHGSLTVEGNLFLDSRGRTADLASFASVTFRENRYEGGEPPSLRLSHIGEYDIEPSLPIEFC